MKKTLVLFQLIFLQIILSPQILLSVPKNKIFSNVGAINNLFGKNLDIYGNAVIGGKTVIRNGATITGNTIIDGSLTVNGIINGTSGMSSQLPVNTNQITTFVDNTGQKVKAAPVTIDNSGNINSVNNIELNGITKAGNTVTWPSSTGAAGQLLASDGSGNLYYSTPAGGGNVSVVGAFANNNRILTTDTTIGSTNIKQTNITLDNSTDNISGINNLTANLVNLKDSGLNSISLKSPTTVTSSYIMNLPGTIPDINQFLKTTSGSSPFSTQWSTIGGGLPNKTQTLYVSMAGSDSNDGTIASPFRTVSWAVQQANGTANASNPIVIEIGPGIFVEDNSGSPIRITADGITIAGCSITGTVIKPNTSSINLFHSTKALITFSNLALEGPSDSTAAAFSLESSAYEKTRFNTILITSFQSGLILNKLAGQLPSILIESMQFFGVGTCISANNTTLVVTGSIFRGPALDHTPLNTGIILSGIETSAYISDSIFRLCDTGVSVTGNAKTNILSSTFDRTVNGITCNNSSTCLIVGCFSMINFPSSINISASGSGTKVYIESCLFDCEDASNQRQGTCIKVINQAEAIINNSTLDEAVIGIECGQAGDTDTTIINTGGVNLRRCTTGIKQAGLSKLQFTGGKFDQSTMNIENSTNVSISSFNSDGSLAIGNVLDEITKIYKIETGQAIIPSLNYKPNYYGHKGTVYENSNTGINGQTFNATQSDHENASYYIITGDNTKASKINLISDEAATIGSGNNIRGWEISKLGGTGTNNADLAFTYTNNDPGSLITGPNTVMNLNGRDNQIEFPVVTGTFPPTNSIAKLIWAPGIDTNTNLYRSATDTLKTDANFIVGSIPASTSTLAIPAGTANTPALIFAGDPNTGIYSHGSDNISFSCSGAQRMNINPTGTVSINSLTPTAGIVHNDTLGNLSSSLIVNADISSNPLTLITDNKLAQITSAGKVANAATTATNVNTPDTIVLRAPVTGNFSAGTITANLVGNVTGGAYTGNLIGNASSASTALVFSTALSGDLSGGQNGTTGAVVTVGGQSAGNIAAGVQLANAATSSNTSNSLVRRGASGEFSAGIITANLIGNVTGTVYGNLIGNADTATLATRAINATGFSGPLAGDVTGTQSATVVSYVGGLTGSYIATGAILANNATNLDSPNQIVKRDGSGNFVTNYLTLDGTTFTSNNAVTKNYVDTQVITGGIDPKAPARLIETINNIISLNGPQTIDSVLAVAGNRVLLDSQLTTSENGLWVVQAGAWTRPSDFPQAPSTVAGKAYVLITEGAINVGSSWICNTPLAVVGTDPISFVLFSLPDTTTGNNIGTGVGQVFKNKTSNTINLRTLAALTSYITVATNNTNNTIDIDTNATSINTPSTLIARDANGNFSANSMTGVASGNVKLTGDTMTGNLNMNTQSAINFYEPTNTNFVGLRAPSTFGTGPSYTIDLPNRAPTQGQVLKATSATGTEWTLVDEPPTATKTYYVTIAGSDSLPNNGSLSAPYRTVKKAVTEANGIANLTNPVVINIGPGIFYEDNSGGGIPITKDGISIIGSSISSTIIIAEHVTSDDFFVITTPNIEFFNLLLSTTTTGSTKSAIKLDTTLDGKARFNSVGVNNFDIAFNINSTGVTPLILFDMIECQDNNTCFILNNVKAAIKSSVLQGTSSGLPANTGITLTGPNTEVDLMASILRFLDTCLEINGGGILRSSGVNIQSSYNGVKIGSGSQCYITSLNTILNYSNSIGVFAKGTNTNVFLEGCNFNCTDSLGTPTGTGLKVIEDATININNCAIASAGVGIECGQTGDTSSATSIIANGVNLLFCTTDIIQRGSSTIKFVGGTIETATFDFEDPTNISMAAFNSNSESTISFGNTTDNKQTIYNILNSETNFPHLMYEYNFYNSKGTIYHNPDTSPAINGILADQSDASYRIITGKNTKSATLNLISDNAITKGSGDNIRGWEISKLANTGADLAFTYTNNDPGSDLIGPNTIMKLDAINNSIIFPESTSPSGSAKLVWGQVGDNSNLYRSDINTLKTDGNFVIGGVVIGSTLTIPTGTPIAPSLSFVNDTNTGIYSAGANNISFSTDGTQCMNINPTGAISINSLTPTAGVVHNNNAGILYSSLIGTDDIITGTITDNKLATITTAGKVANSSTTATNSNTPGTIVMREAITGNFSAGAITATQFNGPLSGNVTGNLIGNSDTATSATNFSGSLVGDVIGYQLTTTVRFVGGQLAADVANGTSLAMNSTSSNTPSTIIRRDGTGSFTAGTITATGSANIFGNLNVTGMSNFASGVNILGALNVTGAANFATGVTFATGTATNPSIKFINNTNTGIYSPTTNTTSFTSGGTGPILSISPTLITRYMPVSDQAVLVWPQFTANGTATAAATTSILVISSDATRSVTINFPPNPVNGQLFTILDVNSTTNNFQLNLTNSVVGPITVSNPVTRLNTNQTITTTQNGSSVTYIYNNAATTWYRLSRGQ